MKLFRRSLRTRIFVSMILLVLGSSIIIVGVSIYQFRSEAKAYQRDKLLRKEASIRASINYELQTTTYPVNPNYISEIFQQKIYELKNIHNTPIRIYDLDGNLLKTSKATLFNGEKKKQIPPEVMETLRKSPDKHYIEYHTTKEGRSYQTSYSYITDKHFEPLAILNLPHIESDGFIDRQLQEFLSILLPIYALLLGVAVLLAYFLSTYIARSLRTVSDRILATRLDKHNEKIKIQDAALEIRSLLKAYNSMIDELEESAVKLAISEREQAWREMARQVAHEIKNPLTPMRLSVQSFERKFDPEDPDIRKKLHEFSGSLIQQIDMMSSIASAFSSFAKMPAQKNEILNVNKTVKLALDIFNEPYIHYESSADDLKAKFDRTQLIRVITNLVKNAQQALYNQENPKIIIEVGLRDEGVLIQVKDNGTGISKENQKHIFEPKFTTKSSGMGLGLGIIKNIVEAYEGKIYFETEYREGTTFFVTFPRKEN